MRIPSLRLHATRQWCVTHQKKTIYFGSNRELAQKRYRDWVLLHFGAVGVSGSGVTVSELLSAYVAAQLVDVQPRWLPSKTALLNQACAVALQKYGAIRAEDFGPLIFKHTRKAMALVPIISKNKPPRSRCRQYVTKLCKLLKGAWHWGVSEEMVSQASYDRLSSVPDLKYGELGLPEGKQVVDVPLEVVYKTLPFLSERNADLVRLLLLTGCRPDELLNLSPGQIDKSDPAFWVFTPAHHKTCKRNLKRVIVFGEEGRKILARYEGSGRYFGWLSSSHALCAAVYRACARAGIEKWNPYRLRHTALTQAALKWGKDVATAMGGNSLAVLEKHYDHGNLERAKRAAG